jgi:general stress protein YciG
MQPMATQAEQVTKIDPTNHLSQANNGRRGRGRGFASMDPAKQRAIASKGGRAAHTQGTAHEWSSDEAREAGRKGGAANRGHSSAAIIG